MIVESSLWVELIASSTQILFPTSMVREFEAENRTSASLKSQHIKTRGVLRWIFKKI